MIITIRFAGSLRASTRRSRLRLRFETVVKLQDVVNRVVEEHPTLKQALIDPELGDPRTNALILINGREISALNGLETKMCDQDEITFVPVVHGG